MSDTPHPQPELSIERMINLRMECLQVIAKTSTETTRTLEQVMISAEFLCDWLLGKAKAGDYKTYLKPDIVEPK